jgi:hypothetical protein
MSKGGGGPSQTTSDVTQTTSNLPEYAEPYYRDLLARTGAETSTEYTPYEGQRLAYFSPMEQEAMARMGEFGVSGTPEELNEAGRMAMNIGQGFDPGITGGITSLYEAAAPTALYEATNRRNDYRAQNRNSGYKASQLGSRDDYTAGSREVGFVPGQLNDASMLESYSNPYTQNVVDIQKREAMRDADIRHQQLGLGAAQQGALGGYRDAIMRAETERDLGQRLDDIQLEGSERAYGDAKASFEADRAARAQAETFGQSQFGMNEQLLTRQSELMQQGFSLDEASRQAQEELSQGQFGMNQQARQAQEQFAQSQFGLNSANAQFGANLEMQKYQAYEAAKQEASRQGLNAQEIEQAGQIAAANIRLGQQNNQTAAAGMLGDFAGQRQAMELERLNSMMGVGSMERGMMQQGLDMGYQDFLRQQAWPREQLAFYSSMLQGTPVQPGTTTATYGPQPSYGQQLMGTGIAGLGLANAFRGQGSTP